MVKLEEVSSSQLRRVIESGVRTAVVPFGSVEDQGGHLPLGSDALLADFVGLQVADRLDAVLAPTLRVGDAQPHMRGSGTLTVPSETLREVAFQIGQSLGMHGFRLIVLISTHGGNQVALQAAAQQLNEQYPEVVACAPRGDVGPDPGVHGGKWLTSVMLLVRPDLVDVESANAEISDELRAATRESGVDNVERYVSAIVKFVQDQTRSLQRGGG
jgi:creatinine amidohydrolase